MGERRARPTRPMSATRGRPPPLLRPSTNSIVVFAVLYARPTPYSSPSRCSIAPRLGGQTNLHFARWFGFETLVGLAPKLGGMRAQRSQCAGGWACIEQTEDNNRICRQSLF